MTKIAGVCVLVFGTAVNMHWPSFLIGVFAALALGVGLLFGLCAWAVWHERDKTDERKAT